MAFLAIDADMAPGLFDEAMHHGEPETRAFAHGFGGEERLEHPVDDVLGDARARVGHAQQNILPLIDVAKLLRIGLVEKSIGGLDGQATAIRHCRAGV